MDRLSQLPDDILIRIWSFLTTEEAYGIRLLSKHWRRHWLLYLDTLDLNTSSFITNPRDLIYMRRPINPNLPALTRNFYRWLKMFARDRDRDHDLAEEEPLGKLRIQSPMILRRGWFNQIDEWISYAFARKVQSLELDFLFCFTSEHKLRSWYIYCFPKGYITAETDLTRLTSLSLSGLQISTDDLDSILVKSPLLQNIKLYNLWSVFGIQITPSSLALKHLEISSCVDVKYVIICNTCLVSLKLTERSLDSLFLENTPKLVSVCISGFNLSERPKLGQLESCLSRLQILTLHLTFAQVYDEVPLLKELKHLTLIGDPCRPEQIAHLTPLLNISPNLEKLVLELDWPRCYGKEEYNEGPKVTLKHLKDIEVRGYCGEEAEDELIRYVLKYVLAPLKRIIFDPRTLRWGSHMLDKEADKSDQMRTELLKRMIPTSLEFIVL